METIFGNDGSVTMVGGPAGITAAPFSSLFSSKPQPASLAVPTTTNTPETIERVTQAVERELGIREMVDASQSVLKRLQAERITRAVLAVLNDAT